MKEAKSDVGDWYIVGWLVDGDIHIDVVNRMSERGARLFAKSLLSKFDEQGFRTFYAKIRLDDDFHIFEHTWSIMKRRGECYGK
jgi:hypothetical protein